MEKLLKTANLPFFAAVAGVLGALIRFWLYATGLDEKNLLVSGHPGHVLIWVLVAAALAVVIWGTARLKQAAKYSFNFPASMIRAAGAAVAAGGMLATALIQFFSGGDILNLLAGILGLISTAVLLFLSRCSQKGLHPSVIFPAVICAYLMVHMICLYRTWSIDPQLEDYCFALLASVSLALACYQDAAFCANAGNRQLHTLFHLLAVFFCIVCLPWSDMPVFYLSMAVWMFTGLCNLTPAPRGIREAR